MHPFLSELWQRGGADWAPPPPPLQYVIPPLFCSDYALSSKKVVFYLLAGTPRKELFEEIKGDIFVCVRVSDQTRLTVQLLSVLSALQSHWICLLFNLPSHKAVLVPQCYNIILNKSKMFPPFPIQCCNYSS